MKNGKCRPEQLENFRKSQILLMQPQLIGSGIEREIVPDLGDEEGE
ncbi:hypothetical protein RvY_04195 [Ramazzottius varieornatus]|uniref:Uncharacterized protein n=1 Tax=Ramazzottius varieornatus TaxID=947166 RepID=A0A1D1UU51_RAMVA|nr:hypothetical protein RvY_04195 [Ramazzottius varieornatus]